MRRQAGVVLPLFSIRSRRDWGIGQITDLPLAASWIMRAGHRLLQVLPPHELSSGETSPYGALTAFGLDPIYLDVEAIEDLDASSIHAVLAEDDGQRILERVRGASRVDYASVRDLKMRVLRAAFDRFMAREWLPHTPRAGELMAFVRAEHEWLDDLALYKTIREGRGNWGWSTWPEDLRDRATSAIQRVRGENERRLLEVAYVQWLLHSQWTRARAGMRAMGVELMGDVPFVVGVESADVWAHASQFQLHVSLGAPPDDFSADGQNWGLPAYDWLAMEADGLAWIRARSRRAADLYDRFRLDHVVGNFRQWVRPQGGRGRGRFDPEGVDAQRARGLRVLGAMMADLATGERAVTPPRAIAEDLGVIPPFVREVLRQIAMPGYRVLPWEKDDGRFRDPREFPKSSVACWSTHDTAPLDGWWSTFTDAERVQLAERAGFPLQAEASVRSLALLADLFRANSDLTLVLSQELLGIQDRINTPATVGEQNWTWRLSHPIESLLTDEATNARFAAVRRLVEAAGR